MHLLYIAKHNKEAHMTFSFHVSSWETCYWTFQITNNILSKLCILFCSMKQAIRRWFTSLQLIWWKFLFQNLVILARLRRAIGAPKCKKEREQTWNFELRKYAVYDLIMVTQSKFDYLNFLLIRIFILKFGLNNFLDFHFSDKNLLPVRRAKRC